MCHMWHMCYLNFYLTQSKNLADKWLQRFFPLSGQFWSPMKIRSTHAMSTLSQLVERQTGWHIHRYVNIAFPQLKFNLEHTAELAAINPTIFLPDSDHTELLWELQRLICSLLWLPFLYFWLRIIKCTTYNERQVNIPELLGRIKFR